MTEYFRITSKLKIIKHYVSILAMQTLKKRNRDKKLNFIDKKLTENSLKDIAHSDAAKMHLMSILFQWMMCFHQKIIFESIILSQTYLIVTIETTKCFASTLEIWETGKKT